MTSKDIPSKALDSGDHDKPGPGPGEQDLNKLLQTLDPILDPVSYIWVALPPGETPPPTLSSSILYQFCEPYYPGSQKDNPTPSAGLTAMSDSAPKTRMTMVLPQPALNAFTTTTMRLGIDDDTLGLPKGTETAFPCRLISIRCQSSLSAVGIIAKITQELVSEGISTNIVSAFYHDYIFVKPQEADLAMDVILDIVDDAREEAGLPALDQDYDHQMDDDDDADADEEDDDYESDHSSDDDDDMEDDEDDGEEVEQTRQRLGRTSINDRKGNRS
jgi:hypothetical protein